jgi:hypothetical protein
MTFHAQNLNEGKYGNGSMWRHGRCWIGGRYPNETQLRIEWSFFKRSNSTGLELSLADYDEDAIGGHVSLWYVGALYWGFANGRLRRLMERWTSRDSKPRELDQCAVCRLSKALCDTSAQAMPHVFKPRTYWSTNGRNIGARWFEGTLWIDIWSDPMEWRRADPWWWHISIHPVDIIFGRTKHEEKTLETTRVIVPMPEGGYPATVRIFESTWRRSRWPWAWRRMVRSDITPDTPIAFPGKGESEYDCGEDSTHSMTSAASTPLAAAMALSESVMSRRIRYGGGWSYRPEKAVA